MPRVRIVNNDPIAAFRWRGLPGNDAARLHGVAAEAGLTVKGFAGVLEGLR